MLCSFVVNKLLCFPVNKVLFLGLTEYAVNMLCRFCNTTTNNFEQDLTICKH